MHLPDWRARAVAAGTEAIGWPGDVYNLIAGVCAWSAILALGRALVRGPRRRLFWVYPPSGDATKKPQGTGTDHWPRESRQ